MNIPQDIGPSCLEGQPFGKNYNPSYHSGGLLGHTGIDIDCAYGSPIQSLTNGVVYSTYPVTPRITSDGYTAVFVLTETPLETFEMSYGHVSEIDCVVGQQVSVGDVLAKEGNFGTVYVGNVLITTAQENAGNHDGHHRHYQKRPVTKVSRTTPGKKYLQTSEGLYIKDGFYYEIYDIDNGFNGCVDWAAPLFSRNLQMGNSGYDVYLLQKACILRGFGSYEPTGFFGLKTLSSVIQLQGSLNLPKTGFVGPMTRALLNGLYTQLV